MGIFLLSSSFGFFFLYPVIQEVEQVRRLVVQFPAAPVCMTKYPGEILTRAAVCASITETEVRVCAVGAQVEKRSSGIHLLDLIYIFTH